MEPLILCDNLVKIYKVADLEVVALQGLDLTVAPGELMAIIGNSGSGKSTLMNIIGALDTATTGSFSLDGIDVRGLDDDQLSIIRNRKIGGWIAITIWALVLIVLGVQGMSAA